MRTPPSPTPYILGDGSWPHKAKQQGIRLAKRFYVTYGKNVMIAQMLEVSLLRVGTVGASKGCVVNGQMTKASNK